MSPPSRARKKGVGKRSTKQLPSSPVLACVFCGGTPLHQEHVWPKWLLKEVFPPQFLRAGARPAAAEMTRYVDAHRERFGVEPICQTLQVAPSTYYAVKTRRPSSRSLRAGELTVDIGRVQRENFGVYGVEKVWRQLIREGIAVGRNRVGRLMRQLGLAGAVRGKKARTTKPSDVGDRPADLVGRTFSAPAPNRLWVADLSYVGTWSGFAYVAFIIDVFSRAIVGWRVATSPAG